MVNITMPLNIRVKVIRLNEKTKVYSWFSDHARKQHTRYSMYNVYNCILIDALVQVCAIKSEFLINL